MPRRLIASGSPFEPVIGFSRAVVEGHHVVVAGTAPVMPDGGDPPADAFGQTRRVLQIIVAALAEAGAGPEHVVRTRTYLTDAGDWDEVGRAHGEVFADVRWSLGRPSRTPCVVARWLATIGESGQPRREGAGPMLKEFKAFILRGNLVEIAVAFIMALAFAAVVA